MPKLDAYAEQVMRETAYFIWKRGALRDMRRIIGSALLSKSSATTRAAMTMNICRMGKRSLPDDQTQTCLHIDQGRARRLNRGRVNIPPGFSACLDMEGFAQTLSVPPPVASTAEFFALTSSSLLGARRPSGGHDCLSQHKPTQWRRQMADSATKSSKSSARRMRASRRPSVGQSARRELPCDTWAGSKSYKSAAASRMIKSGSTR